MPTYGYRCRSCSHEFEVWQRMSDPAGAPCPECSGPGARLFFPAGIVFKGSGFYKTDSRTSAGSAPAAAGADGKAPAGGPASDGVGGDTASKPASENGSPTAPAAPAAASAAPSGNSSGGSASTANGPASNTAPPPAAP